MLSDPTWIGVDLPLAAWFHRPEGSMLRAIAVACGPVVGEDATKGRMAFLALAEMLCSREIGLLRFDYVGTGDSAGCSDLPRQLEHWRASVNSAVDYACSSTNAPCILVGMGLGAILASEVVEHDKRIKGLVLWDPVFSARRYLREQKAFVASVFRVVQPQDGSFAGAGYSLGPESVAELEALQIDPSDVEIRRTQCPTLLATRAGDRAAESVATRFVRGGADHVKLDGQADLMEMPPHEVRLHFDDLDTLAGWISDRAGEAKFQALPPIANEAKVLACSASGPSCGSTSPTERQVIERFRRLGELPLYGTETLPA
ncbi:MAG: hypothetical protein GJU76_09440, partial [Gallionella sp.]|nr:hypothetical protein [Gallionella sp.]